MIRFKNVFKSFGNSSVLSGITGEIGAGEILTVVGPSGSGKSTLLSLCNLLATPDSGEVYVNEKEVRTWNVRELRREVVLVFQTPTMFPGTVLENMEVGLRLQNKTLQNPEMYLQSVGLSTDLLTKEAEGLSGGQKQRIALARVLVNSPRVLLLDEVTSALDPSTAREVEDFILRVHKQNQMTIVWVTHNLEQARRVGNMTWLIVQGKLVEARMTECFFADPKEEITQKFLSGDI